MKHARDDYNRIQDPALSDPSLLAPGATPIGEDEPVILFRAKDKYMRQVLIHYRRLIETAGDYDAERDEPMIDALCEHRDLVTNWQEEHGCKNPDL